MLVQSDVKTHERTLTRRCTVSVGLRTTLPQPSGISEVTVADLHPLMRDEIVGVWVVIIADSSDNVEEMKTISGVR